MALKCGVVLPGGSAAEQLEQAVLADRAGWDGVFVWEAAYGVDAWSLLAAMAVATSRVKLGTMLTPLPWRRPWKVASQVATVDQLSGGRAVLSIGVGAVTTDLPLTGETQDLPTRAAMLDEGIDLMRALWSGGQSYHGSTTTTRSRATIWPRWAGPSRRRSRSGSWPSGPAPNRCAGPSAARA